MGIRQLFCRGVASMLLVATGIQGAIAQDFSGIRITPTGASASPLTITGLDVDIDVTAFQTTGTTDTSAYLGTYYNAVPAIDWGDGSTEPRYGYGPSTGIPLVATSTVVNGVTARAYRGSFSHTYGAAGSYTITANTEGRVISTPTATLVTGTIVNTTVNTTGPFGPTTFTTSFVQNVLNVVVGYVSAAASTPQAIPVLGGGGLILLVGLMSLVGLFFSRRNGAAKKS